MIKAATVILKYNNILVGIINIQANIKHRLKSLGVLKTMVKKFKTLMIIHLRIYIII